MNAQHSLSRLRVEDPRAAAAVVDALWEQLAREDARMFAALWRRATRRQRAHAPQASVVPAVEWVDELAEDRRFLAGHPTALPRQVSAQDEPDGLVDLVPDALAVRTAAEPRDLPREPDVLQHVGVGRVVR